MRTFLIILFTFFSVLTSQAQNYNSLWSKVEEQKENDQPKSALKTVKKIYDKALSKKDFPQMLYACCNMICLEVTLNPEDFHIDRLEQHLKKESNPVHSSIIHAMLGDAYSCMKNSSTLSSDDETLSKYDKLSHDHYAHVLDNMPALAQAKSDDYPPLVRLGKDKAFANDMLSVMFSYLNNSGYDFKNFSSNNENVSARQAALNRVVQVFDSLGMKSEATLLRLPFISSTKELDSIYSLTQGTEIGADVLDKKFILSESDYEYSRFITDYSFDSLISEAKQQYTALNSYKALCPFTEADFRKYDERLNSIRHAQKQYESSPYAINFKNHEHEAFLAKVFVGMPEYIYPDQPFTITLRHLNAQDATLTIRQYNGRTESEHSWQSVLRTDGKIVRTLQFQLDSDSISIHRKAKNLPTAGAGFINTVLPAGRYVLVLNACNKEEIIEMHVSSLRLINFGLPESHTVPHIYTVDAISGKPVEDAQLIVTKKDKELHYKAIRTVTKDESPEMVLYTNESRYSDDDDRLNVKCQILTDRSIYRPGQVVNASVVFFTQQGDKTRSYSDKDVTINISDPDFKQQQTFKLHTNKFGKATLQYTIPMGCRLGQWRLRDAANKARATFNVEEYKRPTFDVNLSYDSTHEFLVGDTVQIKGTASMLTGYGVSNASVRYTVESKQQDYYRYSHNVSWKNIDSGTITTNNQGTFTIPVVLTDVFTKTDEEDTYYQPASLSFRIRAIVTDQSGESHESSLDISVSRNSLRLAVHEKVVNLQKDATITVHAYNSDNKKVHTQGTWTLYHYSDRANPVLQGSFTSDKPISISPSLKAGTYVIALKAQNRMGKTVDYEREINIFSPSNLKNLRGFKHTFLYTSSSEFAKGRPVDIYYAPQHTDAHIFYFLANNEHVLDSARIVTNDRIHHIHLDYRPEYGNAVTLIFGYYKNNNFYSSDTQIVLCPPDKSLQLRWSTFRNRLTPGQHEQWVLDVLDNKGKAVTDAEVLAYMYDASLDRIKQHPLTFDLFFPRNTFFPTYRRTTVRTASIGISGDSQRGAGYFRSFPSLVNIFNTLSLGLHYDILCAEETAPLMATAKPAVLREVMVKAKSTDEYEAVSDSNGSIGGLELTDSDDEDSKPQTESPSVGINSPKVRTDFSETAFFLPYITTDKRGQARISFTLPESLTEWSVHALALTTSVDYGTITSSVVARKEFMIQPNMPRFVCTGDRATISARIINQSDVEQQGTATILLTDANTGAVIHTSSVTYTLGKGETESVTFEFDVPERIELLTCDITATSATASDGERNILPVLSDKVRITENVPFYLDGPGSKELDLSTLFNSNSSTATDRTLSVSYCDTPAQLVFDALDDIKMPDTKDAISLSAAIYANVKLQRIKGIDLSDSIQSLTSHLRKLQHSDGGWAWFEGMQSNHYTTIAVLQNIMAAGVMNEEQMQGLKYLDMEELRWFQQRTYNTSYLSDASSKYMYLCSLVPHRQVHADVAAMQRTYLKFIQRTPRDFTMLGKAYSSITLRNFGKRKEADRFLRSLKEYTVFRPGFGRYFATEKAYYSWLDYKLSTQIAAMRALNTASYTAENRQYLLDMQMWLLRQKQTQNWNNPINIVDAAELLFQISPESTLHEPSSPTVILDETQAIAMPQQDSLHIVTSTPISVGKATTISVGKQTEGISWGAVSGSFTEQLQNVSSYTSGELSISRKLYIQQSDGSWIPLVGQPSVGDKVRVRHIISANRDMDFVHVTSHHPACLEPQRTLSGYQFMGGRGGYLSIHDASIELFFDTFRRGTSTIDMDYYVTRTGTYHSGIATAVCTYAPDFGSHTDGYIMEVKE